MGRSVKNVLVTGGCGFIGSNFLNIMVNKYPQYNFYNLDAMYYCASHDNILVQKNSNYNFIEGNLRSADLIKHILYTHNIDTIVNFAAQSHVDNSFSTPMQYTLDNIVGTHTLLEETRKYHNTTKNLKLFIHVSTDEVYGGNNPNTNEANSETSVLCPTNPYAATKAGAELIVQSYHHSFKMPIIITRGNNVYGPNQYPEKLIPKFIQLLTRGQKCTIHGEGRSVRSFLHVADVVAAFDIILHKGSLGEIYNIGTNDEYTVLEVTKLLIKLLPLSPPINSPPLSPSIEITISNAEHITTMTTVPSATVLSPSLLEKEINYDNYIEYVEDRAFNDQRYFIRFDKLTALGWKQKIDFITGLKSTIQHYIH